MMAPVRPLSAADREAIAEAGVAGFRAAQPRRLPGAAKMRLATEVALADLRERGPSPELREAAAELGEPLEEREACRCPPAVLDALKTLLQVAIEAAFKCLGG